MATDTWLTASDLTNQEFLPYQTLPLSAQTGCKLYANTSVNDSIPPVFIVEIHFSTMTLYPLYHCFGRSQLPNASASGRHLHTALFAEPFPCSGRTAAGWERRMSTMQAKYYKEGTRLPSAIWGVTTTDLVCGNFKL